MKILSMLSTPEAYKSNKIDMIFQGPEIHKRRPGDLENKKQSQSFLTTISLSLSLQALTPILDSRRLIV